MNKRIIKEVVLTDKGMGLVIKYRFFRYQVKVNVCDIISSDIIASGVLSLFAAKGEIECLKDAGYEETKENNEIQDTSKES